ncbi:MAG: GyrI-like domain-containing protein, partial [Acidobacteriota bacterium]
LKALAESLPDTDFGDLAFERTTAEAVTLAVIGAETTMEAADIQEAMAGAYGEISAFIEERGLTPAGPPRAINHVWADGRYVFDAAIPVAESAEAEAPDAGDGEVQITASFTGEVLKITHTGSYEAMPVTYDKAQAFLTAHGHTPSGPPWDVWVSDPTEVPEAELITEIYFPLG